jgi:signal transduction histidine kinase
VVLSVYNRGQPIPEPVLRRMTEPFFSTKSNGTGLGLAIVCRLIEQHGGSVTIRSQPDGRTEVRLTLPRLPDAAQET